VTAVLGLVEHEAGTPDETTLEMLTMARGIAEEIGTKLGVVLFGTEVEPVVDKLSAHGVDEVHHVSHEQLNGYAPKAWGEGIAQLAEELDVETVVAPGTDRGSEVLAHVGTILDQPMLTDCVEVTVGDAYEVTRQRWGGSLLEHARIDATRTLLTASAHEYQVEQAAERTNPGVQQFTPVLEEEHLQVQVERIEESDIEGVPLEEARVVVSGGRGVGNAEDFDQIEELADLLDGATGASRAAVNEGWRPHDDQVGLTGAKISPDIYIPCGISGAIQHMVGCKGSENILAINTDPEAAIIGKAEYAVIGDLHEVLPELNEAIREFEAQ